MHPIVIVDQFAAWTGPEGVHWTRERGTASPEIS